MNNITQVNALIAKGSTGDAAAVSGALDEILKQLAVNRQHVDLFFSLYIKMLDRLFGEDVARAPEPVAANSAWTKGLPGGWLKALASVSQTADGGDSLKLPQPVSHPLGRNINATYLDSLPFPLSALLLKLSPTSPAFDVLSRIQGGCEIKLNLLPTKLQMFVADHPLYPYARARYHSYMTSSLIHFPLNSANQVKECVHVVLPRFLVLFSTLIARKSPTRGITWCTRMPFCCTQSSTSSCACCATRRSPMPRSLLSAPPLRITSTVALTTHPPHGPRPRRYCRTAAFPRGSAAYPTWSCSKSTCVSMSLSQFLRTVRHPQLLRRNVKSTTKWYQSTRPCSSSGTGSSSCTWRSPTGWTRR
jgi:hypothetical protein